MFDKLQKGKGDKSDVTGEVADEIIEEVKVCI
jgi:hypothetical protein